MNTSLARTAQEAAETYRNQVTRLAADHSITDREKLASAIDWAAIAYHGEKDVFVRGEERTTDTLDKLAKTLKLAVRELAEELSVNRTRLIDELAASSSDEFGATVEQFEPIPGEPMPVMATTAAWLDRRLAIDQKIDEWLDIAHEIRLAANRAHIKRGRGNPGNEDRSLPAAVRVLAVYWTGILGREFKLSKWEPTSDGTLVPLTKQGKLATFLVDAMKTIDPEREHLGEELRSLMVTLKPNFPQIKHNPRS